MKRPQKSLLSSAVLFALLFALGSAAGAAPPPGFAVVSGNGTLCTAPNTARAEFGTIQAGRPVKHTFTLRNGGAVPLTLYNLRSSCGCTTAVAGGSQELPVTVRPSGAVTVEMTLDTSELSPGFVDKTVWVEAYTPSGPAETAQLELTGTVGPPESGASAKDAETPAPMVGTAPTAGQTAPAFTLVDTAGTKRSLAEFRGHPTAVFFFCGCPWCADCAREWARETRAGKVSSSVQSLVVFSGDSAETRRFGHKNGLDVHQIVLLPDPTSAVTERRYHLNTCPRVFVLDAAGTVRYTNDHSNDTARVAPASVIVSRAVAALAQ